MKAIIIDDIPFKPNIESIKATFKIKPGSKHEEEFQQILKEMQEIARPKALYKIAAVSTLGDSRVSLDHMPFESQILCINLEGVHRAFPYIATSGIELHDWKNTINDPFIGYLADHIISFALKDALGALYAHLTQRYGLGSTSTMNPGSLPEWPIQAQTPLFSLLGDPQRDIGVRLTESLLMVPRQSVSGLLFETEKNFVNCQLCTRENCPNRRKPYDSESSHRYRQPNPTE